MIMRGTTPRALSAAGFLAVVGLGALLLPLLPTWAQQPADDLPVRERQPGRSREEKPRPDPASRREARRDAQSDDLQEYQEELSKLREQLRHKAQELDAYRAHVEQAETTLRMKMDERSRFLASRQSSEPERGRPAGREASSDTDRRLREVERKLDLLLSEVQGLRQEIRRGHEPAANSPYGPVPRPAKPGDPRFAPPGGPSLAPAPFHPPVTPGEELGSVTPPPPGPGGGQPLTTPATPALAPPGAAGPVNVPPPPATVPSAPQRSPDPSPSRP